MTVSDTDIIIKKAKILSLEMQLTLAQAELDEMLQIKEGK